MKHKLQMKAAMVMAATLTASAAFAQTQITDEAGLRAMANDPAGEYVLANDIKLTGEWTPIGTQNAPFTGKFNGNGHTITGLVINDDKADYAGLFGYAQGATLSNVRIVAADVQAHEHVGILVGRICGNGTVDAVMTSGYVRGRDHIGGIAGDMGEDAATLSNCFSTVNVYSTDYQAGGLVGWSKGNNTITNSFFAGQAREGAYGGSAGIVAFVEDGTTTVRANVSAASKITGVMGEFPIMEKRQRYTMGVVGGILNENSNVDATDNLTSEATVRYNVSTGEPYENTEENTDPTFNGILTPAADLKKASTYTTLGWSSAAWTLTDGNYPVLKGMTLPVDGDYIYTVAAPEEVYTGNVWNAAPVSSLNRAVTIKTSDASIAAVSGTEITFGGTGAVTITFETTGDSFSKGYTKTVTFDVLHMDNSIATAADFDKIRKNPSGGFVLTADIDMAGVDFKPIPNFSGSLDGQNHFIKNLRFENKDANEAGFIANFDGTFIRNLGFINASIIGNANAAIIGKTTGSGVISNVVVMQSTIQGRDHVASFVGDLNGGTTIKNCLSNAVLITREYQAGGIAGVLNNGNVENCLFCGTLETYRKDGTNLGGIVSLLDSSSPQSYIRNCVAAAVTESGAGNESCLINLAGREMILENNYVTEYTIRNGVKITAGEADSDRGALVTKDQVRTKDWYTTTLGWDFDNDWKFLPGSEGYMLPVLKWMSTPLAVSFFNLPSEDGIALNYVAGTEAWLYNVIMGSWGQDIDITQLTGEGIACIVPEELAIYAGDENGEYGGAGSAEFKVSLPAALSGLFSVDGRDTFMVNVGFAGEAINVATAQDFINIRRNPGLDYVLTADIDLTGLDFNGFCNDGNAIFTGSLDGQGHSVKGFRLDFTGDDSSDLGLFGKVAGASFKNIAFYDFVIDGGIQGAKHVGLIGGGSATLEEVAIVGCVYGNDHVGLVAGDADGITITNSYAKGEVIGGSQVGGFFGVTLEGGATIRNCFSNIYSQALTRGWVGGFIGLIDKSNSVVTIENCVSVGDNSSVGNDKYTNWFIGGNGAGDTANAAITFTNNIYNSESVNDAATHWPEKNETAEGGVVEAPTGMNPGALTEQNVYTNIGWDFTEVWTMGTGAYKYPVLKGVAVPASVLEADNETDVEDVIADAVSVEVYDGTLYVAGLADDALVSVYTAAGVQVASVAASGEAAIELPANGLYIVSVLSDGTMKAFKVKK